MYVGFVNKEVKTRKEHKCIWCYEKIAKGDTVQYREYRFDDAFQKDRLHPECYKAMNDMDSYDLMDGFEEGGFKRGSTEYK